MRAFEVSVSGEKMLVYAVMSEEPLVSKYHVLDLLDS